MLKLHFLSCLIKNDIQKGGSLSSYSSVNKTIASVFNPCFNNNNKRNQKGRNQNISYKHCGIKGHSIDKCFNLLAILKTSNHEMILIPTIKIGIYLLTPHRLLLLSVLNLVRVLLGLKLET